VRFPLAAAVLLAAVGARADDMTGRLGLGATAGGVLPIESNSNTLGADLGLWGRYGLDPNWSAGFSFDDLGAGNLASRFMPLLATAAYDIAPKSEWNPSARVGAGLDFVSNAAGGSSTGLAWDFGFSFDRFLTPRLSVGAVVDWLGDYDGGHGNVRAMRAGLTAGWWFDVPRKKK